MAFFREDPDTSFDLTDLSAAQSSTIPDRPRDRPVPLIAAKLAVPPIEGAMPRKWLTGLLEKSSRNAAATMIVGRAGTGKTMAAAHFVSERPNVSWYSIDAVDGDWNTFQNYFRSAVFRDDTSADTRPDLNPPYCASPLDLFADVAAGLELRQRDWPTVLVLDGIHHLFDRPWFHDFFEQLVFSIPVTSHAVMLSRSKPPTPIWRMRSKQVLNVIDEKLLVFSEDEAREYFALHGLPDVDVEAAVRESFGRVVGLKSIVRTRLSGMR